MKFFAVTKRFASTALLFVVSATMNAQTPATTLQTQENAQTKETSNTGVYGRDVFVPEVKQPKEPEPPARSFSDRFLRETPQNIGFSLGLYETYIPDALASSSTYKALSFTSVLPEAYLNFQKKKIDFRLTYGVTYNRYTGELSRLNRVTQHGSAIFDYFVAHRKTQWRFSNVLSSNYYDESSFLGSALVNPYWSSLTPQTYLDHQRENRNMAEAGWGYAITKKASVNVSVTHDAARYSGSNIRRRNALTGSVGAAYRVKKWLFLNTQYSHYLKTDNRELRGTDVQSLQIAGLSIQPGRDWVVSFSGGVDSTKVGDLRRVAGSGQAGITKTSGRTTVGVGYHRGFFTVFPAARVSYGDTANVHLVQSLSRRINSHADVSYIRSNEILASTLVRTVYGAAGLDIALNRHLVFVSNVFLVSQNLGDPSYGLNLHRHTATVGLTYYLPSISSERRH